MKQRLKVFLLKHSKENRITDEELIKYPYDEWEYRNIKRIRRNDSKNPFVYIKQSPERTPKWFSDYIGIRDFSVTRSYAGGFFFRTIDIDQMEYKFAIVFSGAEAILNHEFFVQRFGLKIALNSSEDIYSIRKKKISDTQASITENAIKGQNISDFTLDFEKDLLYGVVVNSTDSDFSIGKLSGRDSISLTTELDIDDLDLLLEECIRLYEDDKYKERFDFIDNISELTYQKDLINEIYVKIFNNYQFTNYPDVWFAQAEDLDWEKVGSFEISKRNIRVHRIDKKIKDLDYDEVYKYMTDNQIQLEKLQDFKKYEVNVYDDGDDLYRIWNLFECMYASVEHLGKQYVLNAGRLYEINKEFYQNYNEQFKSIDKYNAITKRRIEDNETQYNKYLCNLNPDRFTLLDGPSNSVHPGSGYNQFEICDIYDNQEEMFIHVKKYAASAVLSHLFAQAHVSALLFKDPKIKELMINKMNIASKSRVYTGMEPTKSKVVVAIITDKELPSDGYLNIPFFSKVNAVKTLNGIKNELGYSDIGVMFIETLK